jgi:uncharacterized membrane protein
MHPSSDLAPLIDRWVGAGIISTDQAERIRADLASMPSRPHETKGGSLVAEAMGYLGGVIVLVGLGLVVGWFWDDMSTLARIALTGGAAVLLLVAGALVSSGLGEAGGRLRAMLWFGSSGALFGCLAILGSESLHWDGDQVVTLAATGTTVVSAALWAVHRRLPQHIATLANLVTAVGAGTSLVTESYPWPGLAVWGVGVVWVGLSWFCVFPRRSGMALGAISAIIGALIVESEPWGTPLALTTVAALVLAAVAKRDLVVLGVASVGTLIVLPMAVDRYFPGVLPAALSLVGVGLVLVVLAVSVARRRRES